VDVMSSTGGVLSAAHTERDIDEATTAFERTVLSLLEDRSILSLSSPAGTVE